MSIENPQSAGDWIDRIIEKCGLRPDVGPCLAEQLGQFDAAIRAQCEEMFARRNEWWAERKLQIERELKETEDLLRERGTR